MHCSRGSISASPRRSNPSASRRRFPMGRTAYAAAEAHSKGAHALLAPTVNLHRSPLNGRNFACYAEDLFLTARIACASIMGLQSEGVAATIQHLVGNESEVERMTFNSEIAELPLRELYVTSLPARQRSPRSTSICAHWPSLMIGKGHGWPKLTNSRCWPGARPATSALSRHSS